MHFSDQKLAGVVSWGTGCGREDYSGVNTRISSVVDWIDEQICILSNVPPASCTGSSSSGNGNGNGNANNGNSNSNTPSSVVSGATETASPVQQSSQPVTTQGSGNGAAPLYNPRNTDLESYPGEAPRVPTHGVTINVYYAYRPLYVRWNLAMQQTTSGDDQWRVMYRSIRGEAHSLQSQTFTNIQPGSYRFHIEDPEAERQLGRYDVSIGWMSIMGPRGDLIWGMPEGTENEVRTAYDIYFQVTEQGILDLGDGMPPQP